MLNSDKVLVLTMNYSLGLPAYLQVLVTLRFFATGTFQATVSDLVHINQPTVTLTIKAVSYVIAFKRPEFVQFPETLCERTEAAQNLYEIAWFPGVMGSIDCTYIKITNSRGDGAQRHINRKG